MAEAPVSQEQRASYGWVLAGMLGITEMTSWGVLYYTFSVMLGPMQQDLGWSRETFTGAFSLALLVSGVASVPIGRWLDRYGARPIMSIGSCLGALGVFLWANVQTPIQFYLVWIGLGATMAAVLYDPAFAVIARWFARNRSRALTVLTFGGGLASVVYVPLAAWLLKLYGWRQALAILAGILAIGTILPHLLLLRRAPAERAATSNGHPAAQPRISLKQVLSQPAFWLLTCGFAMALFVSAALSVHLISYLAERGFSLENAALPVSLLGGSQIIGRLLLTPLGERIPHRLLTAAMLAMGPLALLILLLVRSETGILAFAVLLGAGYGASSPARAALVADMYGVTRYAEINGVMALVLTLSRALAPIGIGFVLTYVGHYEPVMWILVGISVCAVIAVLSLPQSAKAQQA